MPATAIVNTSLTGIDDLVAYLDSVFLAAGWTSVSVMNSTTGDITPPALGQERVYQINGTALSPARSFVGMARFHDNAGFVGVLFYAFTGMKGPVAISSIVYPGASGPFQVTTAGPHPYVNGDLVFVNGVADSRFNRGSFPTSAAGTISNVASGYFEMPSGQTGAGFSSSGGRTLGAYNMAAGRDSAAAAACWRGNDAAMQLYGAIDEFRCAFIIQQGGSTRYVQLGQTGRRHIPAAFSDTAFTTGTVTGPGPVVINLDRTSPNLCAAQHAWLVAQDSALFERFSVTSVAGTMVTGTLVGSGTYSAGALFGDDPCPVGVIARAVSDSGTVLDSYVGLFSFFTDGTRVDPSNGGLSQTYAPMLDSQLLSSISAGDSSGYQQGRPIILVSSSPPVGVRANIAGTSVDLVVGWGLGSQTDGDLEQTACASTSSYKVFTSQEIDGATGGSTYLVGFGPGAS